MPAKPPTSARPRPGGGFNPGMGFGGEQLDEQALQQAMSQKTLAQQGANPGVAPTSTSGLTGAAGDTAQAEPASTDIVEGIVLEPIKQVVTDVLDATGLPEWLQWLGITQQTPEQEAHKRQCLQRYQALNEQQQAVAKQEFEARMQKKQQEEEERQQRAAAEQAERSQQLAVPQGKKDGAEGMGGKSRKQQATHMVQQQRQSFNSTMSAN